MGRYVGRRLLVAVPTLLALSFLIFALVHAAPGDPAEELARRRAASQEPRPEDIKAAQRELHLDLPYFQQYRRWLTEALTGDLGPSFANRRPVVEVIRDRTGATMQLALAAFAVILILSIPLGITAALFHRRWPDQVLRVFALIGASMPGFFFAYLLIILLVTQLKLLPVGGRQGLDSFIMPVVVLALLPTAVISRLLRSSLLEVFGEDYMRTARSKGLTGFTTIVRHALRNASIPVTTYLGVLLGGLLEGAVIVEFIFSWPGLGSLVAEAISQRDYPMIQAMVVLFGGVYLVINLLVDLSYAVLDPRVRLEGAVERA